MFPLCRGRCAQATWPLVLAAAVAGAVLGTGWLAVLGRAATRALAAALLGLATALVALILVSATAAAGAGFSAQRRQLECRKGRGVYRDDKKVTRLGAYPLGLIGVGQTRGARSLQKFSNGPLKTHFLVTVAASQATS